MLRIECPNCGLRNSQEFRYGGEYNPRPAEPHEVSNQEWVDFVYMRDNKLGQVKEWWYHRFGCQIWFLVERHTYTNRIAGTYRWEPAGPD